MRQAILLKKLLSIFISFLRKLIYGSIISLIDTDAGIGVFLLGCGLGGLWFYLKIKKRQKNIAVCKQSIKEQEDLVNKLQSLS
jgi:hypothetical protein